MFSRTYGLETVCLRYFNVFGPRQDPSSAYAAFIPIFITGMQEGQPLTINGDGTVSRDFTYVANVVEPNFRAVEAEGVAGEVFNVACGTSITLNEIVERLREVLGVEGDIHYGPARLGDVPKSLADIAGPGADSGTSRPCRPGMGWRRRWSGTGAPAAAIAGAHDRRDAAVSFRAPEAPRRVREAMLQAWTREADSSRPFLDRPKSCTSGRVGSCLPQLQARTTPMRCCGWLDLPTVPSDTQRRLHGGQRPGPTARKVMP